MQFKDKNIEQIKITVLVEDTENENLPSAHGLSLYLSLIHISEPTRH